MSYPEVIKTEALIQCAINLRSDDGENKEYDRALCELVGDALGTTQEGYPAIASILGINKDVWNKSNAIAQQREQAQEDILCILDSLPIDQEVIDKVCQVIVDRFNKLEDK